MRNMHSDENMAHGLGYNTQRKPLVIPEYGRNVQQLVDSLKFIKSKKERTEAAAAIVKIMGAINVQEKGGSEQHGQKLYDQLFIMAGFELDIDSPFPTPQKEELERKPDVIAYPHVLNSYRFYGHNIPRLIEKAKPLSGKQRQQLAVTIARHMKKSLIAFNKETSDNETVFGHLYDMSGGEIDLRKSDAHLDLSIDQSLQPTPIAGKGGGTLRRKKIIKRNK